MKNKPFRLMLCALLAAALMLSCALAENPSDDVSGFNPFDPDAGGGQADITVVQPSATPQPMADPFASNGSTPVNDPFGNGATPLPTIGGKNPFDDGSDSASAVAPDAAANSGAALLTPATGTVMFVSASTARITRKPQTKGKALATATFGDQLNVTATEGDWARVQTTKGLNGYCPLASLSQTDPNTLNKVMYAQLNQVVVHRTPSTKSGRMKILKKGDTVTMTAITSDGLWARVTNGEKTGFVDAMYLDDQPPAEGTPVWCNVGYTDVMVNPDAWVRVYSLSYGQQAYLVGYTANNAIAKIRNEKGAVAYCDAAALTTSDPATLSATVYAQASGRVLRNGTTDDAARYNVKKGASMTLLGVDPNGNWALVKQGKRRLYIPFIFLGNERIGKNQKIVVSNQDAPLYQSAQTGAAVLGTLPMGTRLSLMGGEGSSAKVSTLAEGGAQKVVGYLDVRYLYSETQLNTTVQNDLSDIASGFFQ